MFARKVHNLRHFCFSNLIGKYAALADTMVVNVQHDLRGVFARLLKKPLQDVHHELHRRVVVVQDKNPVLTRPFNLRFGFGDRTGSSTRIVVIVPIVIGTEIDGKFL